VKLPFSTTLVAALIVLALAGYEYFSKREFLVGPPTLLLIAFLLAVRYAAQLQRRNRARMIAEVPKRPLGLDDLPKQP
jgi:hypothetical protein